MQNRFLVLAFTALFVSAPSLTFAQSTTSNTTVDPSNSLSVNPVTNQAAVTSNISTQINNQTMGANSYGGGVQCQAPQVALGGYGARLSSGIGLPQSDAGFSAQYLAPLGADANKTCSQLSHQMLEARAIENTSMTIQRCADFARSGIVLDPAVYPDLARSCAGVHVTNFPR
jgi:hypothetical protein